MTPGHGVESLALSLSGGWLTWLPKPLPSRFPKLIFDRKSLHVYAAALSGRRVFPFDQFFPSRTAHHSAQPFVYKRSNDGSALMYEFEGATRTIQDYLNRNPVTGLLIAKDDTILFESYQYGRTDRDRFISQSMGKTVTAMLVGIAVEEGAIRSVDDPVEVYLHRLKGTEYGKASIRNLLNMASGVKFFENYVRKNFVEPWTEVFALWRGVLRAFGQN